MAFPFDVLSWLIRGRYRASPTAVSDGGTPEMAMDALGRLRVIVDSMSGSTPYSIYTPTGLLSKGAIKASAGSLRQLIVTNTDSVVAWIFVFNKATQPSSPEEAVSLTKLVFKVPASDTVSLPLVGDMAFSTGIYWVGFTNADLDTEVAEKLKVAAFYL